MSAHRLFTFVVPAIALSIAQIRHNLQEPRPRIRVGGQGYGRFSREAPNTIDAMTQ